MSTFQVSQTRVDLWRRCKQAHYYRYDEGLEKKVKARPLVFGSLIHSMIQTDAEGDDPFSVLDEIDPTQLAVFEDQQKLYGDILTDARIIFEEYLKKYKEDDLWFCRMNRKSAEHRFELEIADGLTLIFVLDAIGITKRDGLRWIVENKTGAAIPEIDTRWRNLQTSVYIKAIQLMGLKPVDGILWNYIRSKSPTRPQLLKSGELSQKKIDTLPGAVIRTIRDEGLDPSEYHDLIKKAEQNIPTWFIRDRTPVLTRVVESVWDDFICSSIEIRDSHGKRHERTIGRHCSWCDYERICRAELTGGDSDRVKRRGYDAKKKTKEGSEKKKSSLKKRARRI